MPFVPICQGFYTNPDQSPPCTTGIWNWSEFLLQKPVLGLTPEGLQLFFVMAKLLCAVGTGYTLVGLLGEPLGMSVHCDLPLDQHQQSYRQQTSGEEMVGKH